jgi:hypothetical protein
MSISRSSGWSGRELLGSRSRSEGCRQRRLSPRSGPSPSTDIQAHLRPEIGEPPDLDALPPGVAPSPGSSSSAVGMLAMRRPVHPRFIIL